MLRNFLVEMAQNPKVGMALGGVTSSAGAALNWLDVTKEWLGTASIVIGIVLSIAALFAQISRIRNDRIDRDIRLAADRRADAAELRAQELHRVQLEVMRARNN